MKNTKKTYHFIDSWSGNIKRYSSLREAKKNANKDEAIYENGNKIIAYGNREPNIVN